MRLACTNAERLEKAPAISLRGQHMHAQALPTGGRVFLRVQLQRRPLDLTRSRPRSALALSGVVSTKW